MIQQKLFEKSPDPGRARRADPPTAKAAAKSVNSTELETIVLDMLRVPATTHEIADSTGIALVSISPRMAPLVKKGLVQDSGLRREGPSGRKSIVWSLTVAGVSKASTMVTAPRPAAPVPH